VFVNVDEIVEQFKNDVYEIVIENLVTLCKLKDDSSLVQSVEVFVDNNELSIKMNQYAFYLDSGRKPLANRVPFEAIHRWVLKNKIRFDNKSSRQIAFIIRNSIYKKGIRPRKFLKSITRDVEQLLNFNISNEVINQIETDLTNIFSNY